MSVFSSAFWGKTSLLAWRGKEAEPPAPPPPPLLLQLRWKSGLSLRSTFTQDDELRHKPSHLHLHQKCDEGTRTFLSATWWDKRPPPPLPSPPPRGTTTACSIHHLNGLYIFNPCHLSGGDGRGEGIKLPSVCRGSTGRPLIHGPLFFLASLTPLLVSLAVAPCCFAPPPSESTRPLSSPQLTIVPSFICLSPPDSSVLPSRTSGTTAPCTSPR